VDFTATHCIGRGGTGLEQAGSEQPAVDPHRTRPSHFGLIHDQPYSASCTAGRQGAFLTQSGTSPVSGTVQLRYARTLVQSQ
jgi:hypothetical protein